MLMDRHMLPRPHQLYNHFPPPPVHIKTGGFGQIGYGHYPGPRGPPFSSFEEMRGGLHSPAASSPGLSPANSSYSTFFPSNPSSATSVGSLLRDDVRSPHGPPSRHPEGEAMSFMNATPNFDKAPTFDIYPPFPQHDQQRQQAQQRSDSRASSHHSHHTEPQQATEQSAPGHAEPSAPNGELDSSRPASVNSSRLSRSQSTAGEELARVTSNQSAASMAGSENPAQAPPEESAGIDREGSVHETAADREEHPELPLFDNNQTTPFISKLLHLLTHER